MRRLVLVIFALSFTPACAPYPRRRVVYVRPAPPPPEEIIVEREPPPVRVEVAPPAPYGGAVWIPGHWRWDGYRHVWVNGHYEAGRAGSAWEPAHWQREPRGWRFIPGHWRRY